MSHLDNNSVLDKGTSFCVGSWIFVADGSGGFNSRSIDWCISEVSEAARSQEINDFVDQLEEVELSVLNNGTRIQLEFDAIGPKTLSELEEDLNKLLEDTKQETTIDGKILFSGCQQNITQENQPVNSVSKAIIKNYLKDLKEIWCLRVDNSELLNGIDRVSNTSKDVSILQI